MAKRLIKAIYAPADWLLKLNMKELVAEGAYSGISQRHL
jgi:hypothetical protein